MESKKAWVEIPKGYLVLNSKESIELFEELSSTGTLWEQLSVLFNEYADNKDKNNRIEEQMDCMQDMMKLMMSSVKTITNQLPPPSNNRPNQKTYDPEIIVEPREAPVVKKARTTARSQGLGSLKDKMSRFK